MLVVVLTSGRTEYIQMDKVHYKGRFTFIRIHNKTIRNCYMICISFAGILILSATLIPCSDG